MPTVSFEDAWGAVPKETISFEDAQSLPLSAVPGMALQNAPRSASNALHNLAQNPVSAGQALGQIGLSGVVDAVKDRYGGWENVKRTAATDPIGMGLDALMVAAPFTGGKGAVGAASRIPFQAATKVASLPLTAGRKVLKYKAGEMSGLGPHALNEAYMSGKAGGSAGRSFREHYFGRGDSDEPVDVARGAVDQLRNERSSQYVANMAATKTSSKPLGFAAIDNAWNSIKGSGTFRGKTKHPEMVKLEKEIDDVLDEWRNDPGAHTPQGFDALKQRINGIAEHYPYNTNERRVAGRIAAAVKGEIVKQEPSYAKAMKAYETASKTLDELEKSLSLGKKTSYDTALRKLQSVFRNNAYTNYSARAKLAELIQQRAPDLMPMLAGQAANAILPRGLPGKLLTGGAGIGVATAPASAGALIPALAMASPKLTAGVAHVAGMASGAAGKALPQPARAVARTGLIAGTRIQDPMSFAEQKLSPDVLAHVKSAPGTRRQLSLWVRAAKSGRGIEEASINLADAIAEEVGRPDLADRIAQELSGN